MVPTYGPNWRYKIAKYPRIIWMIAGRREFKSIQVPPWCKTRRPIRRKRLR